MHTAHIHKKMEYYTTLLLIILPFLSAGLYTLKLMNSVIIITNNNARRLPPGPKPVPVLGNLPHLGDKPHRSLANFAKTYRPLISLKFGSITTIVVSSSEVAKEMFQKHDLTLSSRHASAAVRANGHQNFSVVWLPVGPKWRTLRKISAIHLLSSQKLDISQALRQEKVYQLMAYVKECCDAGEAIDVGVAFTTSLNLLSNTFFSLDLASYNSSDSGEFKEIVWRIMEEIGKPNLVDCFPMLRFLSVFSMNHKLLVYGNKLNEIFEEIIQKRLKGSSTSGSGDGLDTLLRLMKENESELMILIIFSW